MLKVFEHLPVDAGFTCKPDDGQAVRARLRDKGDVVRLGLVHGSRIAVIDGEGAKDGYIDEDDTDGAVTDRPGVVLTSTHGDCLPLWCCDPLKRVAGIAHAGWRGTLKGIASELIRTMVGIYGCRPEDIEAFIGPGIGSCCFEVGEEVAEAFTDKYPWAEDYCWFRAGKRPHVDIKGINAQMFALEGVERIGISSRCSCCEGDMFWSWRRCGDRTRMLAYIALK